MSPFIDATVKEIDHFVEQSQKAYQDYRKLNLKQRADFLRVIAEEMKAVKQELLSIAYTETHLSIERLDVEFKRTLWQLTSYADASEKGAWLDIRIDTAI